MLAQNLMDKTFLSRVYEVSFFFEILMITLVSSPKQPFYTILHMTVTSSFKEQFVRYWQNSNLVIFDILAFWVSVLLALFIKPDDHECRKRKKSPIVTSTTYNYSFLKIPTLCFFLHARAKY